MGISLFRERARTSLATLSAFPWSLGVALGLLVFFTPHPEWHKDLALFREQNAILRYPQYAHALFSLLALPSEAVAYLGLAVASVAGLYGAVRAFQGSHWMVFTSFAFAWTLYYGQVDGLVAGGLALAWWAGRNQRPILQGAGLILATLKPQLALPASAVLWWWSPSRLKSLLVPAAVLLGSFLAYGFWLPSWFAELRKIDHLVLLSRNLSLWPLAGPWIWLLWPLVLAVPMAQERKFIAVLATTALTSPYFPLPSSALILALPVPWWIYGIAQLPLLSPLAGSWIYYVGKALPVGLLAWVVWPALQGWLEQRMQKER